MNKTVTKKANEIAEIRTKDVAVVCIISIVSCVIAISQCLYILFIFSDLHTTIMMDMELGRIEQTADNINGYNMAMTLFTTVRVLCMVFCLEQAASAFFNLMLLCKMKWALRVTIVFDGINLALYLISMQVLGLVVAIVSLKKLNALLRPDPEATQQLYDTAHNIAQMAGDASVTCTPSMSGMVDIPEQAQDIWVCSRCGFENIKRDTECQACGTPMD